MLALQKRHALRDSVGSKKSKTRVMHYRSARRAICDSDLHFYNDVIPEMETGDVMRPGERSWRLRTGNSKLRVGERVIVPLHHLVW